MPPLHRTCAVYILANARRTVLYTGVTSDLSRRISQHRRGVGSGFAFRYGATRLVWYQETRDIRAAIAREKALKGGSRRRKIALIEAMNPDWHDLGRSLG